MLYRKNKDCVQVLARSRTTGTTKKNQPYLNTKLIKAVPFSINPCWISPDYKAASQKPKVAAKVAM